MGQSSPLVGDLTGAVFKRNADGVVQGEILTLLKRMKERKDQKGKLDGLGEDSNAFLECKRANDNDKRKLRSREIWTQGVLLEGLWSGLWYVVRDFNSIICPEERNRGGSLNLDMKQFFERSRQCVLLRPMFDHFSILLDGGGLRRGPSPFRFENMWLKVEGFKDLLKSWKKSIPWRFRFTGVVPHAKDIAPRLLQLDFTLILSLMQLAMVHASHEHLPFKVIFNLGLPFTNSQEITNGCSKSPKAYQVLVIPENPTLKSPTRGSQGLKPQSFAFLHLEPSPGNLSSKELEQASGGFRSHFAGEKWCLRNFADTQEGCEIISQDRSYLHQAAKLASILKFPAPFSRHGSCIVRRRNTLLYKSVAKFSHKRLIPQALQSDWLVMAATSSFQLQIAHRLKHWIVDFLSFEMVYSLHHLDFRKCSKSGCYDCHQEYAPWQILFAFSPCNPDSLLAIEF
ncbi:hypothetical protein CK203_100599 [Vitis vinifera]|uniref:Uncharacterized protein n=1 Tax=Vitis vinifera TaxID=29760 RepID=A0A438FIK7_VITVI|nr:hypothetical protein CK203_100599 [Vitis vinifera]